MYNLFREDRRTCLGSRPNSHRPHRYKIPFPPRTLFHAIGDLEPKRAYWGLYVEGHDDTRGDEPRSLSPRSHFLRFHSVKMVILHHRCFLQMLTSDTISKSNVSVGVSSVEYVLRRPACGHLVPPNTGQESHLSLVPHFTE